MARPYPSLHQLNTQFCFLSPLEKHNRLQAELQGTVWITPLNKSLLPPSYHLQHLLLSRYGGSAQNWEFTSYQYGLLLKSPDWLLLHQLVLDARYWCQNHQHQISPWESTDNSDSLPPRNRVMITIRDFPLDFWHPQYFRQATSAMGVMAGVSYEGLWGQDRSYVRVLLDCPDLKLIPYKL